MKLRPQFNLKPRDAGQFDLIKGEAAREDISMNEYILRGLEGFYVVLKGQRIAAERAEELNGKEKVAEVAAEKAGEIGRENRPAGIQSVGVGGKGGSVRAPKKGFEVGNNAEIATGGSAGVAAAGISPEGKRGVQKGAAGDHGKLLRGQSVSGVAAPEGKFRGSGKCPHGWVDWMTCRNNGGGCE
jgi:hypothetical protein